MKPNFTQTPNVIYDELLPVLEKGELKVLLFMVRKTFGFHKKKDRVSFSQIQKGTSLGKETITRSIESLEKKYEILIVNRSGRTNSYELNLEYGIGSTVELVSSSNRTSTIIEPKSVSSSNTQNKRNKTNKRNSETSSQSENSEEEKPFDLKYYLKDMEENPRRDLNIIALYLREKFDSLKGKIQSKEQLALFIRRHLRAAKQLKPYTDKQLLAGVKEVKKEHSDIQWTLETLFKILTKA